MAPEDVTQGYQDYLVQMAEEARFTELIQMEEQEESVSTALSGRKRQRPSVTATFNGESSAFFREAMKCPRTGAQPTMARSNFKVPRQVYKSVLKAPILDEELRGVMVSSQILGPTKGAVHKWDQDADASYEAHMASFRLAHHSSLMAT